MPIAKGTLHFQFIFISSIPIVNNHFTSRRFSALFFRTALHLREGDYAQDKSEDSAQEVAHAHHDSGALASVVGETLEENEDGDAEEEDAAEVHEERHARLSEAVHQRKHSGVYAERNRAPGLVAVDALYHLLEGRVLAGEEAGDVLKAEQGDRHQDGTDYEVADELALEGQESALVLPRAPVLAYDRASALLEARLRHGGDSADVVRDSERAHGLRPVNGAHRVHDDLAHGERGLLDDDRHRKVHHRRDDFPFERDRPQREAEEVVLLGHVHGGRGKDRQLRDQSRDCD